MLCTVHRARLRRREAGWAKTVVEEKKKGREEKGKECPLRVRSSMWVLVARILLVRLASSTLIPCSDPLCVTAHPALQCFVGIGVGASRCNSAVDNVFRLELADVVRNGGDYVTTKLFLFAEILTLKAELVLLGHVLASHGTNLVHDVEENGFRSAVAGSCVLVLVTHVASGDVHGAISREGDTIRELLAPT